MNRGDVTEQHKTSGVAVGCSNENPSPRCEGETHFYETHSEVCECGQAARHTTHRCECGDVHWLKRRR